MFFLMVGQLSDIFGRRWFFIFGSSVALIGSIIGAFAKDVNTLIVAELFIGIAVAFQQSFFWVVAELVPMVSLQPAAFLTSDNIVARVAS